MDNTEIFIGNKNLSCIWVEGIVVVDGRPRGGI